MAPLRTLVVRAATKCHHFRRLSSTPQTGRLPVIGVVDLQFRNGGYDAPMSDDDAIERNVAFGRAHVTYTGARTVEEIPGETLAAFDALLFRRCRVTEAALDLMPRLRCVIRMGVGFENLDVQACIRRGVVACNMPDSWIEEVADTTFSHILGLLRRTHLLTTHVSSGRGWTQEARLPTLGLRRIRGMRLGIVGLGRIGTAVALRAPAFGFETSFFDPYVRHGMEKGLGLVRHESLAALLANTDVVSLHCPYNEETHHMLRAETLPMSPIYIVNCARGGLMQDSDIIDALKSGQVLGAGLDCLEGEPMVSDDIALALADPRLNLTITAHSSFYSDDAYAEMRKTATIEALRVLEGQVPHYRLD